MLTLRPRDHKESFAFYSSSCVLFSIIAMELRTAHAFASECKLLHDRLIQSHDPGRDLSSKQVGRTLWGYSAKDPGIKPIGSQILAICLWSLYDKHQ